MVKNSLQKKIFVLALLLMFIPLVLFTVFNINASIKSAEGNYKSTLIFGMKKAGSVVESLFKEIEQASLFVMTDREAKEFLQEEIKADNAYETSVEMNRVYNSLNYLKNSGEAIDSIQILGVNGRILSNGYFPQSITENDWERAVQLNGQAFWSVETGDGLSPKTEGEHIYQLRVLKDPNDTEDTVGVVKIYMNETPLDTLFLNEEADYTSYFIADPEGNVHYESVSENGPQAPEHPISSARLAGADGDTFTITENGKKLYVTPYYLDACGWFVYSLSEPAAIQHQLKNAVLQLLFLGISCMIFCICIALLISRKMCMPLIRITSHMKLLEEGDFSARVAVTGNDEISLLSRQFNKMAQRIQSLIEEVYVVNLRKKELELRALQAQVNPHFLYNTLDMIYWTAKMEHASETGDMINSLSQFFRQALSGKEEFTTVENEIEHLRYYIILRRQSRKMFDFDLKVDEELLRCRVIKFVLQPLVENAVLHGIRDKDSGKIEVAVFAENDRVIYTISDNGQGVDVPDMNRLMKSAEENHRGFGIKNINDRIQLVYGCDFGIHFENISSGGTKVTVVQPRREWTENDKTDDCR